MSKIPTSQGAADLDQYNRDAAARLAIRDVVEAWAIWRDSGEWDRLLTLWHDDGEMVATWMQAPAADFVASSRAASAAGLDVLHRLAGTVIDVAGSRAVAQTKMTISQRTIVDGVTVDVACDGRFYDFFEERGGLWKIVLRQPIYERDRIDSVIPGRAIELDTELLSSFPAGYRHLAYLQTIAGMQVKRDMPGRSGPEIEALYARGRAWLAGRRGHPGDISFPIS
jgi:hypothetical protein